MEVPLISRLRRDPDDQRVASFATFAAMVGILGYRGWDSRHSLMPLDVVFVKQSLDPSSPYSGINTPIGQFDVLRQFSGYLHTIVRLLVELFGLAPLSMFPMLTFVVSTLIWSACGWSLFVAVRSISNRVTGFVAALMFCLQPASNVILLGQLNALQWPLLVSCVVLVATGWSPRTRMGRFGFLALLSMTSASAALVFIPIGLLIVNAAIQGWRRLKWPLLAMIVPYFAQVFAYVRQSGRRADQFNPTSQLLREMAYIPKTLLPGSMRGAVDHQLGVGALALFGVVVLLFMISLVGSLRGLHASRHPCFRIIVTLLAVALISGPISVVMNGNLNHQYLLIPTTCFWIANLLCINWLLSIAATRHLGQAAALFVLGVFVFSSIATWKKGYSDQFFDRPTLARLDTSLERARIECDTAPDAVVDVSGTGLTLPCEIVATLR